MADLHIPVKGIYFDQIRDGEKLKEFRLCTAYWAKRLEGRAYRHVVLTRGYPKGGGIEGVTRLTMAWRGFSRETITHKHFGPEPVEVFAIDVSKPGDIEGDTALPLKAYSVCEREEGTGSIFFARHAISARRAGANEHSDGELYGVRCNRAPWADQFAETGIVPVSVMVENGWFFECHGCGVRINEDLPNWQDRAEPGDTFRDMLRAAREYRSWTPADVVGTQHSAVFCNAACQEAHIAYETERERRQDRAIAAFKQIVLKRLPDAVILPDVQDPSLPSYRRHHHAYATKSGKGRWRVEQIIVGFEFPGMKIAPASLEYRQDRSSRMINGEKSREHRMPGFLCCAGDKEAFEAWAAQQKQERTVDAGAGQ